MGRDMAELLGSLADFLGPVALVAMLSSVYGTLRQKLKSEAFTQFLLGALFGLVSVLEMHAPIEPFEGLIIDLRNIPIALAGAFLGVRGLLVCLFLAALTRIGIGGVGTLSGVAAMTIAGFAGFLWAELRRRNQTVHWSEYVALSFMTSTHLVAVVLLPKEIASWFLLNAGGPLILLNTLCIGLVSMLLDREAQAASETLAISAARSHALDRLFLSEQAFLVQMSALRAANGAQYIAGFLALRLNYSPWIARHWGHKGLHMVLRTLKYRFLDRAVEGEHVALTKEGLFVLPLTIQEMGDTARVSARFARAITTQAVDVGSDERLRIHVSCAITAVSPADPLHSLRLIKPERTVSQVPELPDQTAPPDNTVPASQKSRIAGPLQSGLFAKADHLMRTTR